MLSKIRIEYDFETKTPVLRITHAKDSDDLRDTMLKSFVQCASWEDSRLYITYPDYEGRQDNSVIEIRCEKNVQAINYENNTLFSRFQIGDECDYTTDKWVTEAFREAKRLDIKDGGETPDEQIEYIPKYSHGKIAAIRFTTAKVYYDILDDFSGEVVKEIVSHQVKVLQLTAPQ